MPLAITGTGAVTPAGWGAAVLLETLRSGIDLPTSPLERALADDCLITQVKRVPNDSSGIPKAARLRRTSPISKFAAAAAIEALGTERLEMSLAGRLRVGVILTLTNGCVNYSNRFFAEVLANPAVASPILFPETVFNAPSSHLSAIIGSASPNDTLIGDSTGFITGLDLAAEWLERGDVDGCLVVAAEEIDWLSAEALCLYSGSLIPAEGAAAVYVEAADGRVRIRRIPDPLPYQAIDRETAARVLRQRLAATDDGTTLLLDSTCGVARFDQPETSAWHDWTGPRWSPKRQLGDLLGAATGIQIVAAAMALQHGLAPSAVVSSIGSNQQAAGVVLGQK
jgi:3-oxoacyl-(acyl-carrier-protein) synthase